ncbi:hypothetical protein K435DRAFT_968838 [Dendrothele bispora CBS 962.96]|uniref:Peroxin-3 n=1 Tax=Dendrothele bispora (strain CBS 962.96) TaxID=1314807 RepID=A0A4S8LL87_DENBC|nr:hypothetical protein K435DRAFT_968838 [Dendrothele bispora CBS 962.96]
MHGPSSSSSSSTSSTVLTTIASTASKAAIFTAGLYLVRGYVTERLEDVKEKLESERIAKDILKRRFEQTQEDVGYTVMAMLPSLAEGVLDEMDVEGVTNELKGLGKEKVSEREKGKQQSLPSSAESSQLSTSGLRSWVDTTDQQQLFHSQSNSQSSSNGNSNEDSSEMGSSFISTTGAGNSGYGYTTSSIAASASASNLSVVSSSALSVKSGGEGSDVGSASGTSSSDINAPVSSLPSLGSSFDSNAFLQNMPPQARRFNLPTHKILNHPKSKSALWLHLLHLTLTRTVLTSYTISLLSLFTSLQLTLLARAKYVRGIIQKAKDEEIQERFEENMKNEFSLGGILVKMVKGKLGWGNQSTDWGGPESLYDDGEVDDAEISFLHGQRAGRSGNIAGSKGIHSAPDPAFEALSTKYLTLSYHFLHVGWRDLAETVREAVVAALAEFYIYDEEKGREEKVTLKTKLSQQDIRRLMRAIRRRVEGRLWDLSGEQDGGETSGHLEGTRWIWTKERVEREGQKREMFCRVLLPKTQEEIRRTLIEGGWRGDGIEYPEEYGERYQVEECEGEEDAEGREEVFLNEGIDLEASPGTSFSQISEESSQLSTQDQFQTSHLEVRGPSTTTSNPLLSRNTTRPRPLPTPTPPLATTSSSYVRPLPQLPTSVTSPSILSLDDSAAEYAEPERDSWPNDRSRYSMISISDTTSPLETRFEDVLPPQAHSMSSNDSVSSSVSASRSPSRQHIQEPSSHMNTSSGSASVSRPESRASASTSVSSSSHPSQSLAKKRVQKKTEKETTPPPPPTNHSLYPYSYGPYTNLHPHSDSPSSVGLRGARTAPSPRDPDPAFTALLSETQTHLVGADFAYVLGKSVGGVLRRVVGDEEGEDVQGSISVNGVLGSCFGTTLAAPTVVEKASVVEKGQEKGKARLAALLPTLARWSKDSLVGLPNVVVDEILATREVKAWEGVVFGEF